MPLLPYQKTSDSGALLKGRQQDIQFAILGVHAAVVHMDGQRRQRTTGRKTVTNPAGGRIAIVSQLRALDLNAFRKFKLERTHGHIKRMAAEITHKSIAVIKPATPGSGMVHTLLVRPNPRRSTPEVPIQSLGNRICLIQVRGVASPGVVCMPHVDIGNLAEEARFDQLNTSPHVSGSTTLVASLGHNLGPAGKFPKHARLRYGMGQGFLTIHVLLGLDGHFADGCVPVICRRNDNRIQGCFLVK